MLAPRPPNTLYSELSTLGSGPAECAERLSPPRGLAPQLQYCVEHSSQSARLHAWCRPSARPSKSPDHRPGGMRGAIESAQGLGPARACQPRNDSSLLTFTFDSQIDTQVTVSLPGVRKYVQILAQKPCKKRCVVQHRSFYQRPSTLRRRVDVDFDECFRDLNQVAIFCGTLVKIRSVTHLVPTIGPTIGRLWGGSRGGVAFFFRRKTGDAAWTADTAAAT